MKNYFTFLVLGTLFLYAIWFIAPFFWGYLYEGETLNLLSWNGYGGVIDANGPIPYVIGLAYVIVSLGLIYYKNWARFAFLLLTCFSVVSAPFWGMQIQTGYEFVLTYLVALGDGAILVIAYLTNVSNEFNFAHNNAPKRTL